jgi:two-component system response regulator YesN
MLEALKKRLNKIPLFYKYLITYAFLLILPVLVTGFFVYHYFVVLLQTQVLQSNRGMLEQVRDTMDSQLAQMRNISIQLSLKREFDSEQLGQAYLIYKAKERISMYSEANSFFTEVVYKARGLTMLISSKSTYLLPVFYNIYLNGYLDYGQYEKLLDSDEIKVQVANSSLGTEGTARDERYITYAVPVPEIGSSKNNKGTLLYLIKEKEIKRLLQPFLPYKKSNVYIMDDKGQLITSLFDTMRLPEEILHSRPEVSEIQEWDEELYYVSRVTSPSTGWTYITVVSEKQLMRSVNEVKTKAIIALVLILVLGCTIIYVNMHVHYNPLRKLILFVDTKLQLSERSSRQGLDKLESAFDYMSHRSLILESEMQISRPALQQQLLSKLLQGQIGDREEFREKGLVLGIQLLMDNYRVICMQAHLEGTDSLIDRQLRELWRTIMPDEVELYGIDTIQPNQWVWVQSFSPEFSEAWSEWHAKLTEKTGISWTVGVGEPFNDLSMLPKSYIGAISALQYRLILGSDRVILPEQMNSEIQKYSWHPTRELEMLAFYLHDYDMDNAEQLLRQISENVRSRSSSLLSAKYIYFDLLNTLVKTAAEAGAARGMVVSYPDIIELTRCTSYQQMNAIVRATLEQISPMFTKEKTEDENLLLKQILELLYTRYPDPQFSIQGMSSQFTQSISYLTRYFKEHTGRTISEYLHAIRIDEAKRLLSESDLTVAQIVQQIGYSDPSSFIRKFKAEVQLTPGEYRKRMQERASKE